MGELLMTHPSPALLHSHSLISQLLHFNVHRLNIVHNTWQLYAILSLHLIVNKTYSM